MGPLGRLRSFAHGQRRELRRWLERTDNLTRLSVVLFVPLLIAFVTFLSNAVEAVSFLLFPPLASGTYTLFADPEGRYSSPRRFVGGLTVGAACGSLALWAVSRFLYEVPPSDVEVHAGAAALGILLTAVVTWALSVELPTAFSTALLVLFTGTSQLVYVAGVALSSALVAVVFYVWREEFYEERASYLYHTTDADDRVLVPMRGGVSPSVAMLGARLAAAHEAGRVVLLGFGPQSDDALRETLERTARHVETKVGVPCEVGVAEGADPVRATRAAVSDTGSDLVVAPFDADPGATFVRDLFRADVDVVGFRPTGDRQTWRRVLVPVRRPGDVAHAMLDYAERLAGPTGDVAVCTCIDDEAQRRRAESRLANLAETVGVSCETRVSRSDVESFLRREAAHYDVVFLGASTDRSAASRFLSRPTYERVGALDTDVAVVHTV